MVEVIGNAGSLADRLTLHQEKDDTIIYMSAMTFRCIGNP